MQQDVLTLLSSTLALLREESLKAVREGNHSEHQSICNSVVDKVVRTAFGRITRFLNFSSGSIHCKSDVLHYFKVRF